MRVRAAFAVHAIGLMATLWMSSLAFGQADWTQRFPTHVPPKRMYPAMAQFGSCSQSSCGGNVVMFGGLNLGSAGNFNQFNALSDTWVWNGTDWTQVSTIATPPARYGASMAYDFTTGSAVLFGGQTANGQFLSDTWLFKSELFCSKGFGCASSFSWTQVTFPAGAATPPGRAEAVMATKPGSPPSLVGLTGGVNRSGLNLVFLNDTWIFNTGTKTWTQQTVAGPPARSDAAMASCFGSGLGTAELFGGFNGSFVQPLGDTWIFNFDLPQWFGPNLPQTNPGPRFGHRMAHYPVSGFRVLYGGQAFNSFTHISFLPTDTWNATCNPAPNTWSSPGGQATPAHNPGHKDFHGMTTGPGGFTVLLFGGNDQPFPRLASGSFPNGRDLNETWTWGRRVACLPVDGSQISVHSEVSCQFDQTDNVQFGGWTPNGFKAVSEDDGPSHGDGNGQNLEGQANVTFRANGVGAASITANWTDAAGSHTQTFNYTVAPPNKD
jgi:hypothetical protein